MMMRKAAFACCSPPHRLSVPLLSCIAGMEPTAASKTATSTATSSPLGKAASSRSYHATLPFLSKPEPFTHRREGVSTTRGGPFANRTGPLSSGAGTVTRRFSASRDINDISTINGSGASVARTVTNVVNVADNNDNSSLDGYYHIEASNASHDDDDDDAGAVGPIVHATRLTVTGPDVDGILASMTVALAVRGCSLVSLHAGRSEGDTGVRTDVVDDPATTPIMDVFYVVDRNTGRPFLDSELYDLAVSLLEALRKPMAVMGANALGSSHGTTGSNNIEAVLAKMPVPPYATQEEQITILRSGDDDNNNNNNGGGSTVGDWRDNNGH